MWPSARRRGHRVTVLSRSFNPWLEQQVAAAVPITLRRVVVAANAELQAQIDAADVVFFMAGASTPTHADRNIAGSTLDSVLTALIVLDLMRHEHAPDRARLLGRDDLRRAASLSDARGHPLDRSRCTA